MCAHRSNLQRICQSVYGNLMPVVVFLLSACSTAPMISVHPQLFHDDLFQAPTSIVSATPIFKADAAIQQFIANEITSQLKTNSHQRALFNALYNKAQLRLEYDSSMTRNASEAFAARSGNCLSLVIMTAAIAKEMNVQVQYQKVMSKDEWSRSGNLYFASGHVNIVIGQKRFDQKNHLDQNYQMTIDFLPPEDTAGQRTIEIEENTIVAMYFNNRAAESMVRDDYQQAYWFAKAAIQADLQFAPAYNTLGVIYMHHQQYTFAQTAFASAMQLEPDSTITMSNMVQTLTELGQTIAAQKLNQKLLDQQPYPPFYFFHQGLAAMNQKEYSKAKSLFQRELKRAPDYHEFHFWLGVAHYRLGDLIAAQQELNLAKQNSTNQKDYALYAAKLNALNASSSVR